MLLRPQTRNVCAQLNPPTAVVVLATIGVIQFRLKQELARGTRGGAGDTEPEVPAVISIGTLGKGPDGRLSSPTPGEILHILAVTIASLVCVDAPVLSPPAVVADEPMAPAVVPTPSPVHEAAPVDSPAPKTTASASKKRKADTVPEEGVAVAVGGMSPPRTPKGKHHVASHNKTPPTHERPPTSAGKGDEALVRSKERKLKKKKHEEVLSPASKHNSRASEALEDDHTQPPSPPKKKPDPRSSGILRAIHCIQTLPRTADTMDALAAIMDVVQPGDVHGSTYSMPLPPQFDFLSTAFPDEEIRESVSRLVWLDICRHQPAVVTPHLSTHRKK